MDEKQKEATKPIKVEKTKRPKKKFFQRRFSWYLMGFLVVILLVMAGILLGASRGVNDRISMAETQAAPKIQSQLESARLDIEEERYDVALGRLDWILEEMTEFLTDEELAEIGQLYSETLLLMNASGTPTPQPTPTATVIAFTPTPDLRGEEEMFTHAQELVNAEAWQEAIDTLEALREKNLDYRTVEVDGLLYIALRNRGVQKILVDGSLEPGIYDLTLAEQFAPLDATAEGFRTWARFYLTGASFWGVDWSQVVYYFEQVYPALPNLRDGTNMTATERFRIGAIEYAKQLAAAGDFCAAQEYFDKAFAIADDPQVKPTAQWVADECWKKLNPPTPEPTATPEVTPTSELTEEPTEAPTEEPTEPPAPTPTPES
jgi:tetratricopeptide (TPR) repeat protein